jgi:hypothetical protein
MKNHPTMALYLSLKNKVRTKSAMYIPFRTPTPALFSSLALAASRKSPVARYYYPPPHFSRPRNAAQALRRDTRRPAPSGQRLRPFSTPKTRSARTIRRISPVQRRTRTPTNRADKSARAKETHLSFVVEMVREERCECHHSVPDRGGRRTRVDHDFWLFFEFVFFAADGHEGI